MSVAGLTARVRWDGMDERSPVEADGSFLVALPDSARGFGFLTIEPDASAELLPAWVLLTPGDAGGKGNVVLLPRTWTVAEGQHAGAVVDIDPDMAADASVLPSYWGFQYPFRQDGFFQAILDRTLWTGTIRTWPAGSFPLLVAIDREGSRGASFTAADSVLLWQQLDRIEHALGRDAFRPARIEEIELNPASRKPQGAVLVQFDTTQSFQALGRPDTDRNYTWLLGADTWQWSDNEIRRMDVASADIVGGAAIFRSRDLLGDRQLVAHIFMHILGAGHGCSWVSVQTFCASKQVDLPSPEDVAYLEVLEMAREMEKEFRTRWGVVAAVAGFRTVTLGLPPLPVSNVVFGPNAASDMP